MITALSSCSRNKHKPRPLPENSRVAQLLEMYETKKELALELADSENGWIVSDCDGMLWNGKYNCGLGGGGANLRAAEYPGTPGRYNRRPEPFCEAGAGSQTSWSRDMGMGLISAAWCQKDLPLLEAHAAFGTANLWKMGEPLADGRVVYTPAMIGKLYQTIRALGGPNSPASIWPSVYPSGLDDYQAHLQILDIWLRGEIEESRGNADAVPRPPEDGLELLDVTHTMWQRIKEHAAREPACPFYRYMEAIYVTADIEPTLELLLEDRNECQYLRCDGHQGCHVGEWLFVAKNVLDRLE